MDIKIFSLWKSFTDEKIKQGMQLIKHLGEIFGKGGCKGKFLEDERKFMT